MSAALWPDGYTAIPDPARGTTHREETPEYAAFPRELCALPQWVVWKRVTKEGATKPTKIPYAARTGHPAVTTDPDTWATFDEAVAALAANETYTGIGFVFTEADPY